MRYGIGLLAALLLAPVPALAGTVVDLCGSVDFPGDVDPPCTDLDCGPDGDGDGTGDNCFVTKYGFSNPADRDFRVPPDDFDFFANGPGDFEGSYILVRSSFTTGSPQCGPERSFFPYLGQVLIRELSSCTPTAEFPTCIGGKNEGLECLWIGESRESDCPGGGVCDATGGCPFEIPPRIPPA